MNNIIIDVSINLYRPFPRVVGLLATFRLSLLPVLPPDSGRGRGLRIEVGEDDGFGL